MSLHHLHSSLPCPVCRTGRPCICETESQFEGIRGFLWLAVGFLLLPAAPPKAEEQRRLEGSAVKAFDSIGHAHEWVKGDSTRR